MTIKAESFTKPVPPGAKAFDMIRAAIQGEPAQEDALGKPFDILSPESHGIFLKVVLKAQEPLYQAILTHDLTGQAKSVFIAMLEIGEPATAKFISEVSGVPINHVSTLMGRLETNHLVLPVDFDGYTMRERCERRDHGKDVGRWPIYRKLYDVHCVRLGYRLLGVDGIVVWYQWRKHGERAIQRHTARVQEATKL